MEPIPPIARRERALRGVEPVSRLRLLTPAERKEAKRERERRRANQHRPQDPGTRADHFA